jgi:hypothetical protein
MMVCADMVCNASFAAYGRAMDCSTQQKSVGMSSSGFEQAEEGIGADRGYGAE